MSMEQNVFQLFKYGENATFSEPVFKAFVGSVRIFKVLSEIYSDIELDNLIEAKAKINYLGALMLSNHDEKARDICIKIMSDGVTEAFEELLKTVGPE